MAGPKRSASIILAAAPAPKKMRYNKAAKLRKSQGSQHNFTRTAYQVAVIPVPAGGNFAQAFEFSLANLPNNGEFQRLFDEYMITKVEISFIPTFNTNELSAGQTVPNIHSAFDYNDGITPVTLDQVTEYESHRFTRGTAIHKRILTPAVNIGADQAGVLVAADVKKYQWINTQNSTVAHRGLKVWITGGSIACNYDLMLKYHLRMKNVK